MTRNGSQREKAIAVGLILPAIPATVAEDHLEELRKLIEAAGGDPAATVVQERGAPDPATWIGRGKAEQVQEMVEKLGASLVVFDDDLAPGQVRNLEKMIKAKIVDRSGLILDIFARRARSRESQTQVELAQLEYLLPRLTRQWTHLSRQAGGIGTRGVGETQLEIDRRMIRKRITKLKEELKKIERTRETQRRGRARVFKVALVGYTNAGKSTLFNQLTGGSARAEDLLFATLDAKLQKTAEPMPRETVIIDTVGFVRKLPHHLVASFRSTMEEAVAADLVLHVLDVSHPRFEEQREVGNAVLADLGIPREKILDVLNKIDRLDGDGGGRRDGVAVSALRGAGLPRLLEEIRVREVREGQVLRLQIPVEDAKTLSRLYELADVQQRREHDSVIEVTAWIPRDTVHQFEPFAVQ
ncbi:MAG TPA: GTPase HflX [Thermoanaerobaculia bacterium]|nr:GTPase HflX [Thermoanaerobaculia bacterium]